MTSGNENVRAAILRQAVSDYKAALRKRNGGAINALERFFMSEWGQMLSGGRGSYIIERCRKCVGTKPKDRNVKNS